MTPGTTPKPSHGWRELHTKPCSRCKQPTSFAGLASEKRKTLELCTACFDAWNREQEPVPRRPSRAMGEEVGSRKPPSREVAENWERLRRKAERT